MSFQIVQSSLFSPRRGLLEGGYAMYSLQAPDVVRRSWVQLEKLCVCCHGDVDDDLATPAMMVAIPSGRCSVCGSSM